MFNNFIPNGQSLFIVDIHINCKLFLDSLRAKFDLDCLLFAVVFNLLILINYYLETLLFVSYLFNST